MLEQMLFNQQGNRKMIAIVGAGGKTTTMMDLARFFKAQGCSVLVTTTTRIFLPEASFYDHLYLDPEICLTCTSDLKGSITVIGSGLEPNGKIVSVESEWLDYCYAKYIYDVILIEADGAKHKPIKAPAEHEPVIPQKTTHVIGVIGLDAIGTAIEERNVHRADFFKNIVNAIDNEKITKDMIVKLILHPLGLFKNAPHDSEKIVILNKAVNTERVECGRAIQRTVGENAVMSVIVRG